MRRSVKTASQDPASNFELFKQMLQLQNNALFQATMSVARDEISQKLGGDIDKKVCDAENAILASGN